MERKFSRAQSRLFVRHETRLEARFEVHPDHADQYRLCFPDAQSDVFVTDVSKGGMAMKSGVYLPKNLSVTVTVSGVRDGQGHALPPLRVRATVRRCQLVDHKPGYQIGLQFTDPSGRDEAALARAVAATAQEPAAAAEAKG